MANHVQQGEGVARIVRFPVGGGAVLGAWIGFALGLLIGTILAAVAVWLSDRLVLWEHDLSYTLGVSEELLPLGDQVPTLEMVRNLWFVFIPVSGVVMATLTATFGSVVGALLALAYNALKLGARFTIQLE